MSARVSSRAAVWVAGWRLALRLARRDAVRAKARSAMVLVMIALPVLAVTAAVVLLRTSSVSSTESLPRRIGDAQALITVQQGDRRTFQMPDPDEGIYPNGKRTAAPTRQRVEAIVGDSLLPYDRGDTVLKTPTGTLQVTGIVTDFADPATHPLLRLRDGRLPTKPCEVVVNPVLQRLGFAIGDTVSYADPSSCSATIVGIADSADQREGRLIAGMTGALPIRSSYSPGWLVTGDAVTWPQVLALNALGATVVSRQVIEHPPTLPPQVQPYVESARAEVAGVIAVLATMVLLEVVLLAGPAFAVGARRQARDLALIATSGGTPSQARRVVLGTAVVLGGVAAVGGVVLGIGAARLLQPLAQTRSYSWFGPFEVPWLQVFGAAAFGLVAALLAAFVPALIASRQDVVAVLAGRRADKAPSLRSPLLGLVLLGLGVLASAIGSRGSANGIYLISVGAIVSVLGMVLIAPVVVVTVARLGRRLPVPLRYAVRDAARHRTRTVPAVAAVAATVAGVVSLGIALASLDERDQATYTPQQAMGTARVVLPTEVDADRVTSLVRSAAPDARIVTVEGVRSDDDQAYVDASLRPVHGGATLNNYPTDYFNGVVVGDTVPTVFPLLTSDQRREAAAALRKGTIVAFVSPGVHVESARLRIASMSAQAPVVLARAVVPVHAIPFDDTSQGLPPVVLPPSVARSFDLTVQPIGLELTGADGGTLSRADQSRVDDALAGLGQDYNLFVERGYQTPSETRLAQLILGLLGAVLMLGGTLTATFLALSDARGDLATLSAIGAAPRTRRLIAAAYAVAVGGIGSLLGAAIGFIPGIAVSYPLTRQSSLGRGSSDSYLAIPWPLVATVVVGLPLLTALIVVLSSRGRLPMVSRLT